MLVRKDDLFLKSDKVLPGPDVRLHLPNLHLNYYINKEKGYVKGVCLDFGFILVKDVVTKENYDELNFRISEIKEDLIFMAKSHIYFVMTNGNFDLLFKNRVSNQGGWEDFAQDDNREHSQLLKNSIDKLKIQIIDPDRAIEDKLAEITGRVKAVSEQKGASEKLDKMLSSVIYYQYDYSKKINDTVENITRDSATRV